jgi:hypothetical protein
MQNLFRAFRAFWVPAPSGFGQRHRGCLCIAAIDVPAAR